MNWQDYLVLFASIGAIAFYGILRTRGRKNLHDYLRGQKKQSWFLIGLSVMATQASAITFLSTPGQGYDGGLSFVQNYFAVPVALIIISVFFLPLYRKLNVYTAYEFLGTRFDKKTRLLAAALFLLQRGLGAGYTLYAPAIVLSTVFGWSLQLTILASGIVVIAYTVVGGSDAVTHTQKYQLAIIFVGMIAAFVILLHNIPCSFADSLALAGHFGKLNAVDFSLDPHKRYTFWTGMLGGLFLMLSYFGADQSQVQHYIAGDNLRESRLGLMFNALLKIPMQFAILLLGVLLFVFYQFHPAPPFFNKTVFSPDPALISGFDGDAEGLSNKANIYIDAIKIARDNAEEQNALHQWVEARNAGDQERSGAAINKVIGSGLDISNRRKDIKDNLSAIDPATSTNDSDYIFITFILDYLPHGLIGLLVAAFFSAALSSKAAELNALASTTTVDIYLHLKRGRGGRATSSGTGPSSAQTPTPSIENGKAKSESRTPVLVAKLFTVMWGLIALAVALFLLPHFSENLIQATNIVGSLFYGVILGLIMLAFFFKFVRGTAAFSAAVIAQTLVLTMFTFLSIPYLWYNLIGCAACIVFAVLLNPFIPPVQPVAGFPVGPSAPEF